MDKHSNLLRKLVNYGHDYFYDTGPSSLSKSQPDQMTVLKKNIFSGLLGGPEDCKKLPNFEKSS